MRIHSSRNSRNPWMPRMLRRRAACARAAPWRRPSTTTSSTSFGKEACRAKDLSRRCIDAEPRTSGGAARRKARISVLGQVNRRKRSYPEAPAMTVHLGHQDRLQMRHLLLGRRRSSLAMTMLQGHQDRLQTHLFLLGRRRSSLVMTMVQGHQDRLQTHRFLLGRRRSSLAMTVRLVRHDRLQTRRFHLGRRRSCGLRRPSPRN